MIKRDEEKEKKYNEREEKNTNKLKDFLDQLMKLEQEEKKYNEREIKNDKILKILLIN